MKSKVFTYTAILIPIIGIVFGIILGNVCQINVESNWYNSPRYVFNFGLMYETWIFFDLLALFFGWLASVLKKLENIEAVLTGGEVENDETIQKIKSFNKTAKEKIAKQYEAIKYNKQQAGQSAEGCSNTFTQSNEIWYCSNCGKQHQGDTNICDCGTKKP